MPPQSASIPSIHTLNAITPNWSEGPNGMLVNQHPTLGGIIDHEIVSKEWFVIFNAELPDINGALLGFVSRESAIAEFCKHIAVQE